MEGIFAINKPKGYTSHDIVAIVRRKTGIKRVGHGGTLDPLAEGVLVIAVGRENTKQLDEYVKGDKEYLAEVLLGANSSTDDEEGDKEYVSVKTIPSQAEIEKLIKKFIGIVSQTPPLYSSVKINGKPAHRRVRAGQKIEINSRKVKIKDITIDHYEFPILKVKVTTGPGVYIRSIARDLGEQLSTGGYLKSLIRTKVGKFEIKDTLQIEDFKK